MKPAQVLNSQYIYRVVDAKQSRVRHLAKTITWRVVGTVDTILVGWLVSGDATMGLTIGGFEMASKTLLYYFHERAWFRYGRLGREDQTNDTTATAHDS